MSLFATILLKVTVVLAVALAGTRLARKSRASVRHVVLSASFAILLALPLAAAIAPAINVPLPISTTGLPAPVVDVFSESPRIVTDVDAGAGDVAVTKASSPISWSSIALTAWLCGVALFLLPVGIGLRQMRSLRRDGLPWLAGQRVVDDLAATMGIRHRVDVLLHESISGPMTCGVVRSVILLPSDADSWPVHELQSAIIHELEHVRRGDWISQCLARTVSAAYWFHPMVWIAWRHLALEAERACDDAVLKHAEATAYADQLVVLARRLSSAAHQPQLAMANRRDLSRRVLAVLDGAQRRGRAGVPWVIAASAVAVVVVLSVAPIRLVANAFGVQAAATIGPKPKYDAATIKPCEAEEKPTGARGGAGGTNATFSPGRFYVPCVTTEQLIYLAYASYGATDDQRLLNDDFGTASNDQKIRGGPSWVHSLRDKYQIEASAAGATERTVLMGTMLQSLLEDRFRLKTHRDTEEVPLLTLTVGKGGFKLKPMKDGDCDPDNPAGPPAPGGKPKCGNLNMAGSPERTRWTFGTGTMSSLASQLSRALGVHVVDQTGIADKFVFTFEFQRGQDPLDTEGFVAAAVEEQLGLTLSRTKGQRAFIVIDSIERPTPNEAFDPPARGGGPHVERTAQMSASKFDTASIKPCAAENTDGNSRVGARPGPVTVSPGRLFVPCSTAEQIIYIAYASYGARDEDHLINDDVGWFSDATKVRGGPAWVHSPRDTYSIEATAAGAKDRQVLMGSMLRSLFEDRFHLRLHRETEEITLLGLSVASSGFKLKPMKSGDCSEQPRSSDQPPARDAVPECGSERSGSSNGKVRWTFAGFDLSRLAWQLSRTIGIHVADMSGITGKFVFSFEFTEDADRVVTESAIRAALSEQLGLKLTPTKGPRGFIVIDSIERPSPNMPAGAAGAR